MITLSSAFTTLSHRRRPTFGPIIKTTTMQSSIQGDDYTQISHIPPHSNSQYYEQSMAIDILLPVPNSAEAKQ